MSSFYYIDRSKVTLNDLVLDQITEDALSQFVNEQKCKHLFEQYQIPVANKLLLFGESGCGKTYTAKAIAHTLNKKIMIVNLATIISSKLGETAKNLDQLFKETQYESLVLLLDEFDSLGQVRDYDNKDNSEMKRVVNAIIQLMDYFPQKSILVAATNQIHMIDDALKRRFEWQISYELPSDKELDIYYEKIKINIPSQYLPTKYIYGVSYASAKNDFHKKVKENIIAEYLENEK